MPLHESSTPYSDIIALDRGINGLGHPDYYPVVEVPLTPETAALAQSMKAAYFNYSKAAVLEVSDAS